MQKRAIRFSLAALCAATLVSPAGASILSWSATMDSLQEVPTNASPGTGFVTGTLDDVSGLVTLTSGIFSGLLGATTAAHIHGLAPVGSNAGVLIGLSPSLGVTSGTITGGGTLTGGNIAGMVNGLTYVNLHTQAFPGGEIRGQIIMTPVPEPVTLVLAGAALAAAASRRRKRA